MKVCWNITSKCNRNCRYCFKFNKNDLSLDENIDILNRLVKKGVNKIGWSGGEPFIYKDFLKLLEKSKEYGIINHVNTNASLLNLDTLLEQTKYIDRIIISLDFIDDELNSLYGIGDDNYSHVSKVLKKIKKDNPSIEVQINTVVFDGNVNQIDKVYQELLKYDIDIWKIVRFYPIRGKAFTNKDKLGIKNSRFNEIKSKYDNKDSKFRIIVQDNEDMGKKHIIVLSSGKLITSEKLNDVELPDNFI